MSEREPPAPADTSASAAETNAEDLDASAEDFEPLPRKRFFRDRAGSSPAPQKSARSADETASEG